MSAPNGLADALSTASFGQLIQALTSQYERQVVAARSRSPVDDEPRSPTRRNPEPFRNKLMDRRQVNLSIQPMIASNSSKPSLTLRRPSTTDDSSKRTGRLDSDGESDPESVGELGLFGGCPTGAGGVPNLSPSIANSCPSFITRQSTLRDRLQNTGLASPTSLLRVNTLNNCGSPYKIKPSDMKEQQLEGSASSRTSSKHIWETGQETNLWQLSLEEFRRGGVQHIEMENKAEETRLENDNIHEVATAINEDIRVYEAELLTLTQGLHPFTDLDLKGSENKKLSRNRVEALVSKMEIADHRLASLRSQQLMNIERIRGCKVNIWCLVESGKVDNALKDVQAAMRSGKDGWSNGPKRKALSTLEETLWKRKVDFAEEYNEYHKYSSKLTTQADELEAKLEAVKQTENSKWECSGDEQELLMQLMLITSELKVISWKRSRIRDKQWLVLNELCRLRRAQRMLSRHAETEKIARSGDVDAIKQRSALLVEFQGHIQLKATETKNHVQDVLQQAVELTRELRGLKHVQDKEADAKRDRLLHFIADVQLADTRLGWLRKGQLQAMELYRLLRTWISKGPLQQQQLANSQAVAVSAPGFGEEDCGKSTVDLKVEVGVKKASFDDTTTASSKTTSIEDQPGTSLKDLLGDKFRELDDGGTGHVLEDDLRRLLVAVGLAEEKAAKLLAASGEFCRGGKIDYNEFLDWLPRDSAIPSGFQAIAPGGD